eukprot:366244-Chlamydomonas_euryale.AAC.12
MRLRTGGGGGQRIVTLDSGSVSHVLLTEPDEADAKRWLEVGWDRFGGRRSKWRAEVWEHFAGSSWEAWCGSHAAARSHVVNVLLRLLASCDGQAHGCTCLLEEGGERLLVGGEE